MLYTCIWIVVIAGFCHWKGLAQTNGSFIDVIEVTNGAEFGEWTDLEFCPQGMFAIGYDIKFEEYKISGDDTMLNGIRLVCADKEGNVQEDTVTSGVGPEGQWRGSVICKENVGKPRFLSQFSLQAEESQGTLDDCGAVWILFQCRDIDGSLPLQEINIAPGAGIFGSYGDWSSDCPKGSAICGLSTRIAMDDVDQTGLNDAKFYCCPADV